MAMEHSMASSSALPEAQDALDWRVLWSLVRRQWLAILMVTVVTVIITALVANNLTPIYKATSTLLLENRTNRTVKELQEVTEGISASMEYLSTQVQVAQSRDLLRRVVAKLRLDQREDFVAEMNAEPPVWSWRRWVRIEGDTPDAALTPEAAQQRAEDFALDKLERNLKVEPVIRTQLLRINYESDGAALSAEIANAVADAYIDGILEARLESSRRASSWLTERLQDIRKDLERSEKQLQQFRESQQIVSVGGERGLLEQDLTDSAQKLREARRKKTELEAAYSVIQRARGEAAQLEQIGSLMELPLVSDSKAALIKAKDEYRALDLKYGEKHPKIVAARQAVEAAETTYRQQLVRASEALKNEYQLAVENERALGQAESQSRGQIRRLDQKDYEMGVLERNVQTNREMYQLFLSRFKGAESTDNFAEVNARIIEKAEPAKKPFKPRVGLIVQLSVVGGLILGVLLVWMRKQLSGVVNTVEDLERISGVPQLSVLPKFAAKREGVAYLKDQKSGFAEGVRGLRTAILLSEVDQKKTRLLLTSSVPHEGKTTIAINLAAALGQMQRVLLIDCDLRRPSVHKYFHPDAKSERRLLGVSDLLLEKCTLEQAIQRPEGANFDLLLAGGQTPNPAELIGSRKFQALLELLAKSYDRVIIDTPPVQAVSDALLLSAQADAVILVARSELTHERILRSTVRDLHTAKAKVLGTVINVVNMRRDADHYARYYYRYGYYS